LPHARTCTQGSCTMLSGTSIGLMATPDKFYHTTGRPVRASTAESWCWGRECGCNLSTSRVARVQIISDRKRGRHSFLGSGLLITLSTYCISRPPNPPRQPAQSIVSLYSSKKSSIGQNTTIRLGVRSMLRLIHTSPRVPGRAAEIPPFTSSRDLRRCP
jgi:hypothetical protein